MPRELYLVPEVAPVGEDHRAARLLARVDDVGVPLRPTRLDDGRDAGVEGDSRAVREGEEGVRGKGGAAQVVPVLLRFLDRDPDRVDAAPLPGADAGRGQVLH